MIIKVLIIASDAVSLVAHHTVHFSVFGYWRFDH